jgi:two-component system response regulator GlrR
VLLRALQERTVRPLGSDVEVQVDARIVSATHQSLRSNVTNNTFRGDLYARLAQATISLPAMRQRRREILSIARNVASGSGIAMLKMTSDAAEALVRHDWPFNVRELESIVRAFIAFEGSAVLDLAYLRAHDAEVVRDFRRDQAGVTAPGASENPRWLDRSRMERLLLKHGGNVSEAASELRTSRVQVYRLLKTMGLDPTRFRPKR